MPSVKSIQKLDVVKHPVNTFIFRFILSIIGYALTYVVSFCFDKDRNMIIDSVLWASHPVIWIVLLPKAIQQVKNNAVNQVMES